MITTGQVLMGLLLLVSVLFVVFRMSDAYASPRLAEIIKTVAAFIAAIISILALLSLIGSVALALAFGVYRG